MKKESKFKLNQVVLAALFAALTTVLTYYVKIPSVNGYMHIGDSMIYLCASILPTPLAALSAGIGAALSDAVGGYTMYIIPTFIIKALLISAFCGILFGVYPAYCASKIEPCDTLKS